MFSSRCPRADLPNQLPALRTRALARAAREGRPFLDLSRSNPTQLGLLPPGLDEVASEGFRAPYEPNPLGLELAREAVAAELRREGRAVDAGDLVLTASTSEAYSFLLKLLCDPGDRIAVPSPSYPLFEHLAALEGVRLATYRLVYDGAWHIDFESLERAVREGARAIFAVHPNNPTGSCASAQELERLGALGLPLVLDEVFAPFRWRDSADDAVTPERLPGADEALQGGAPLVFSLDGLSKRAGLPHLKLAWMTVQGPQAPAARARLEYIADCYLSVAGPTQRVLPGLLEVGRRARRSIHERVVRNWQALGRACAETPVTRLHAEGGWTAVLRLPRFCSEQLWLETLAIEDGLWAQPGWLYDMPSSLGPVLVVSLVTPETEMSTAATRLVERVAAM